MRLLRSALTILTLALAAGAVAQGAFTPVPGTPMLKTPDYGELPKEIVWKKDGAVMVLVPGGESKLGRASDGAANQNDSPEVTVSLPSFYIDKFEVSNARYRKYVEGGGGAPSALREGSHFLGPDLPVVAVPFSSAADFAKWAKKELPTEAMWEKAARGPAGDLFIGGQEADLSKYVIGRGANGPTEPVDKDTGDITGYGVFHMTGNVREWCSDYYDRNAFASAARENPTGPADGTFKVTRGAGYFSEATPENARLTRREAGSPNQSREDLGFRTVFVLRPAPTPSPTPQPTPPPQAFDPMEDLNAAFKRLGGDWEKAGSRPEWRAPRPKGTELIEFGNFTPHKLALAFVTISGGVLLETVTADPCSFRELEVPFYDPHQRTFLAVGIMDDASGGISRVANAGEISAAKELTVIIPPSMFSDLRDIDGKVLPNQPKEMQQHYEGNYRPIWDEIEIVNYAALPVEFSLTQLGRDSSPVGEAKTFQVDGGSVATTRLTPGQWQLRANYVGSTESAAPPWSFTIDDKAEHRIIRYVPDPLRTDKIRVFTRSVPYLTVDMLEARPSAKRGKAKGAAKPKPK